jgi:G3E family GTPase
VPLSYEQLSHFLETLPSSIYRVKGLVKTPENKMLVINKVGVRTTLEETVQPELATSKNMLVLIGFHISQHQQTITESLDSLT